MASKVSVITDMLVNRASREFTDGKMNTEREDDQRRKKNIVSSLIVYNFMRLYFIK
jgi:hypothetical protein